MNDYYCNTGQFQTTKDLHEPLPTHWCNLISFHDLPSSSHNFLHALTSYTEPTSYKEASQDSNWVEAMKKEIDALQANGT